MNISLEHVRKIFVAAKAWLGIGISISLLWLTFHQSGLSLSAIRFSGNVIPLFLSAIGIFLLTILIQAHRTRLIWMASGMPYTRIHSYASLVIGNFYNCMLPGNIGEGIRAWHFHRRNAVSFSRSLAAIAIEKWIDAQLYLSAFVLIHFMHRPHASHVALSILDAVAIIVITVDTFLFLIVNWKCFRNFCFGALPSGSLRLAAFRLYVHFRQHLRALYNSRWLWVYIPVGYAMFLLSMFQYGILLKAAGVGEPVLGIYPLLVVSSIMIIAGFIPSAPSGAGVVHFGVYTALCNAAAVLGIANPSAELLQQFALMSVYLHLSYFLPEVILGVVFLLKERKWVF